MRALRRPTAGRLLTAAILGLASVIGLAALLYPFVSPPAVTGSLGPSAHSQDAPLITVGLVALCLGAVLATLGSGDGAGSSSAPDGGSGGMNSRMVAILGVLTAVNAVLRAVPGPAGFAAVFMLPVLCGYSYGATFGFLLGALSILVSALIGAGVGPWLPFQMFVTGWVGLTAGWLPRLRRWPRAEVVMLGLWGLVWGLAFGALLNLWFWPYVFQAQQAEMYWQPGVGLAEGLRRYAAFYVLTSLWWDLGRAAGNAGLIWLLGRPLLRLLRRFERRFRFTVVEAE